MWFELTSVATLASQVYIIRIGQCVKLQSNFNGSNIFGTMGNSFKTWVVRATEG